MNIFKPFYKETKSYLKLYGESISRRKHFFVEFSDDFGLDEEDKICKWFNLIRNYLEKYCDNEEREFIRLLYFKKKSINYVSQHINLCERACQEWREELLKNIIAMAIQENLISIH